jgi:hypothetical protein
MATLNAHKFYIRVASMGTTIRRISSALAAAALAASGSAFAARDFSFSDLSGAEYDTAGVFVYGDVNFSATVDDGGGMDQVLFRLYDDGVIEYEETFSLPVGESGSFEFATSYPGLVGTEAAGIGLYLYDIPGSKSYFIDPYYVPHYADPSGCSLDCGAGPLGPVATALVPGIPEPSTWAMMLLGLALIGLGIRRRTQHA